MGREMGREAEKRNERLMLAAVFFFWFSVYTYPSFLTSYAVNELKASTAIAGMIVGSYGLMQMALRIPLGILSDVLKKRKPFAYTTRNWIYQNPQIQIIILSQIIAYDVIIIDNIII